MFIQFYHTHNCARGSNKLWKSVPKYIGNAIEKTMVVIDFSGFDVQGSFGVNCCTSEDLRGHREIACKQIQNPLNLLEMFTPFELVPIRPPIRPSGEVLASLNVWLTLVLAKPILFFRPETFSAQLKLPTKKHKYCLSPCTKEKPEESFSRKLKWVDNYITVFLFPNLPS